MSETKHTPGPWEVVPGTESHGPYVTSNFGNTIADLYTMSQPAPWQREEPKPISFMHEMAEANAHLIAAAPEMFEALKACRNALDELLGDTDPFGDDWRLEACQQASAAISKAQGSSQ